MAGFPNRIIPPSNAVLPQAPTEYARQFLDQYSRILEIYFAQNNSDWAALLASGANIGGVVNPGGRFLTYPMGSFFSNVAQTTTANVATVMTLNNTDSNATIATSLSNGSVLITYPGVYNYQFSAQFFNTASQDHDVDVWIRINGVDGYESATQLTVPSKHGSANGAVVAAWNFLTAVPANSTVDLVWAPYNGAVTLGYAPSQSSPFVRPSIPSLITTVTFVSALPA